MAETFTYTVLSPIKVGGKIRGIDAKVEMPEADAVELVALGILAPAQKPAKTAKAAKPENADPGVSEPQS